MKNRFVRMMGIGVSICLPMLAPAGIVNDSNNSADPRYMTTGCRYQEVLKSSGSIGIWVKNISAYGNEGAVIFGSCHINSGASNDQGLLLYINSSGNYSFRVAGDNSGEIVRYAVTADGSSVLLNDGSWHFLLGTFDVSSRKMSFYIDGKLVNAVDIDIVSLVSSRCFSVAAVGKTS